MPPLRGVFHAAMGIDDDLLVRLDQQRFRQATAAKVEGAWNLHTQTLRQPLDHFVLFSSFASLVGNPGQANYTAAHTFLHPLPAFPWGFQAPPSTGGSSATSAMWPGIKKLLSISSALALRAFRRSRRWLPWSVCCPDNLSRWGCCASIGSAGRRSSRGENWPN